MAYVKTCENCGRRFEASREHARFDTARCRVAWNRANRPGYEVHVLKVDRRQENLDELHTAIKAGHTVDGWQMPAGARPGDLAVWYAASPRQHYCAWGWVEGAPEPGWRGHDDLYSGPVAGVRRIEPPVKRQKVAEACGFNKGGSGSVNQKAQTVDTEIANDFLRAVGLDVRLVAARDLISNEVAQLLGRRR